MVRKIQRRGHRLEHIADKLQRQRFALDALRQRAPRQVAHHQVGAIFIISIIINWDDMGMFQRSQDLGLALEARLKLRAGIAWHRQHLDGNTPPEFGIEPQVHLAHAPFAQFTLNLVTTDLLGLLHWLTVLAGRLNEPAVNSIASFIGHGSSD